MLTIEEIKNKYGHMCSFAIWKKIDISQKPKYGVGYISHFNYIKDLNINRNIVLVGLNLSGKGSIDKPFSNFHNPNSTSHDYKIRFAVQDSIFSIGAINPIIIAFGNDCFKILNELKEKYKIFKVPHYSSCISKEKLRDAFDTIAKCI